MHTAQMERNRSKVTRETLNARGACSCGWRGAWHPTRTTEGFRLAERDAIGHARARNGREG